MNVFVHYPKDPANVRALQVRVAAVHAQAILQYLEKLACPKDQKLQLIHAVEKSIQALDATECSTTGS